MEVQTLLIILVILTESVEVFLEVTSLGNEQKGSLLEAYGLAHWIEGLMRQSDLSNCRNQGLLWDEILGCNTQLLLSYNIYMKSSPST